MGDALVVNVGGAPRCMVAEMAPNILSGGQNVPQLRFICDGYCGIYAKRPSKACRQIDRQANASAQANTPPPPGLVRDTQTKVPTPYYSGGGGGTGLSFGRSPFQNPLPFGG
jgi:hypothetical protein